MRIILVLLILMHYSPSDLRAADELPQKLYSLEEEQPYTGSKIRKEIVNGVIPFNKSYNELTEDQKNIFKSQYEDMGPNDEPPYPIKGSSGIHKSISSILAKLYQRQGTRIEGIVSMIVDIDADGQALSVEVLSSPTKEITQSVASILLLEKYKPALCAGMPCALQYPFIFDINVEY